MIVLHIPRPPSLNRLWMHVRNRRVRTPEYNAWLRDAGWEVKRQCIDTPRIDTRYDMELLVPISRRDTGNWEKAIGDLLEKVGVVTNDGNLNRLTITPVDRDDCCVCLTPAPEMSGIRKPARQHAGGFRTSVRDSPAKINAMRKLRARTMV